jgi:hypothetical protein
MESAEEAVTYPRCLSGARRCPPEDCGGVHGYAEFLFNPRAVVFDDPRKRFKKAFKSRQG